MSKAWIGFDFDGTLAEYDEWVSASHCGDPIAPMVERVKRYLRGGYGVKIVTARVSGPDADVARKAIENWCKEHIGTKLEITNCKDFGMLRIYDDRAVAVEKNTGRVLGGL